MRTSISMVSLVCCPPPFAVRWIVAFPVLLPVIKEVKSRGAFVVLIAEPELDIEDGVADIVIKLPQADQLLMPMVAAVPLQLIAYYTAVLKGNDVDKPRNLAKSVTVE